jgi:hypothetical protein
MRRKEPGVELVKLRIRILPITAEEESEAALAAVTGIDAAYHGAVVQAVDLRKLQHALPVLGGKLAGSNAPPVRMSPAHCGIVDEESACGVLPYPILGEVVLLEHRKNEADADRNVVAGGGELTRGV